MSLDAFDTKTLLSSKTVWGALVAILGAILSYFGIDLSPADQGALVEQIGNGVTLVGALLAIWGRATATKQIGGSK
jgi:hypothetical protein